MGFCDDWVSSSINYGKSWQYSTDERVVLKNLGLDLDNGQNNCGLELSKNILEIMMTLSVNCTVWINEMK